MSTLHLVTEVKLFGKVDKPSAGTMGKRARYAKIDWQTLKSGTLGRIQRTSQNITNMPTHAPALHPEVDFQDFVWRLLTCGDSICEPFPIHDDMRYDGRRNTDRTHHWARTTSTLNFVIQHYRES
jgi:hypothetical protein